jgi:hypothetical protein
LELLQQQATSIKLGLRWLMDDLLARVNRPPYALLDLSMWLQQSQSAETWHCRWRNKAATVTGVRYWVAAVNDKRTPEHLLPALLAFEQERIALNAQMSITHHILKQARECAEKFNEAEQAVNRKGRKQR